jgi:hypothetical protein
VCERERERERERTENRREDDVQYQILCEGIAMQFVDAVVVSRFELVFSSVLFLPLSVSFTLLILSSSRNLEPS